MTKILLDESNFDLDGDEGEILNCVKIQNLRSRKNYTDIELDKPRMIN